MAVVLMVVDCLLICGSWWFVHGGDGGGDGSGWLQ